MRVLYSIPMCLFFLQSDKWDGKFPRQKRSCWKLPHSYPLKWCQKWTEEHEESLYHKVGGRGCHRIVTLCVGDHYDNEHSFSIIITSWAPFPFMQCSEGNMLWQFYLLHCMTGLFLENHFLKLLWGISVIIYIKAASHNVLLGVKRNKFRTESNNVYKCRLLLLAKNICDCFLTDCFWWTAQFL